MHPPEPNLTFEVVGIKSCGLFFHLAPSPLRVAAILDWAKRLELLSLHHTDILCAYKALDYINCWEMTTSKME